MTIAGENTAETAILTFPACFPDSVVGFVADPNKADVRFVKYYLDTIKYEIKKITKGATQDNLSIDKLRSFDIPTPPVAVQQKIAGMLSAYDDLIDNNARRIATLEEMAQALYREWFVSFRFPGHENVPLVPSHLGNIRQGWNRLKLADVVAFHVGGGWGQDVDSEKYCNAAAVIRGTDIPGARHLRVDNCPTRYHTTTSIRSRRLIPNDLVFEVSGGSKGQPVGRCLFVSERLLRQFDDDLICASFCKLIRCDPELLEPEILYHYLLESYEDGTIERYEVQSTGIKNFKFNVFLESEFIAVPPKKIRARFTQVVRPLLDHVHLLGMKNENLRQTRDLLLPKLIAGQLEVEHLAIDVGEPVGSIVP
jgi:type I restriction enzyme S subunit